MPDTNKIKDAASMAQEDKIKEVASMAQEAFWAEVVKHFPEIKRGDFGISETFAFDGACERAVTSWVNNNQ